MITIGNINKKSSVKGMGSFTIFFEGSSNLEQPGQRGLHHLAEHLVCHAWDDLQDKISSYGLSYNAMTYNDKVIFYWHGLDRKIEELINEGKALDILGYVPSKEQFDNEKKIVLQEYDDGFNEQRVLFENINRAYYGQYSPIGLRSDIESITYEDMLHFMQERFSNPTSIIRVGKKMNSKIKFSDRVCVPETSFSKIPELSNVEYHGTFDTTLLGDFINIESNTIPEQYIQTINQMWTYGLNSPLYQEIREKRGLVYGLGLYNSCHNNNNANFFYASTSNPKEVRDVFMDTIANTDKYITEERFEIIRERAICKTETTECLNYNNLHEYYSDVDVSSTFLKNMKFEDVKKYAQVMTKKFTTELIKNSADKGVRLNEM